MKKYKLQSKILFTNIMAVTCVIAVCFILFSIYFIRENTRQFQETSEQKCETIADILDNSFFLSENSAVQLANNPDIKNILNKLYYNQDEENYFLYEHAETNEILQYMYPYLVKQNLIYRICFYNEGGDFLSCGSSALLENVQEYAGEKRLEQVKSLFGEKDSSSAYIVYTQDVLQDSVYTSDGYIAVIRPIRDSNIRSGLPLGYLEIHLSLDGIKEQVESVIENECTEIFYQGKSILKAESGRKDGSPYIVSKDMGNGFGIRQTCYNTDRERVIYITILFLFLIAAFMIISMILISKRIVNRITDPLISLFNMVQKAGITDISSLEETAPIDETRELGNAFKKMMLSLQNSAEQAVALKTEKINAQLLALQAQIDPHFIHNTLAIISALSDEGENQKVKDVSSMLSSMIRYSSDYSRQDTTIELEINNIRSYLKLIGYRYEDDFKYKISMEEDLKEIKIPKFILQPLVENAIQHSLKKVDFPWEIKIVCFRDGQKWYIEISDNGIGIEKEKIDDIKSRFSRINESGMDELLNSLRIGGFSLMNILVRLYIWYKDRMEFDIYRNRENGTTVLIGGVILAENTAALGEEEETAG